MHADYTGKGVDQLAEVIHKIKNNPTDRRILLTAWNPAALKEMALPPCHMFCQFYVAKRRAELSNVPALVATWDLGVPFNIASYSLLTCMIAQVCGLKPGDFVHCCGDTHVYSNHVEPLRNTALVRAATVSHSQDQPGEEGHRFLHLRRFRDRRLRSAPENCNGNGRLMRSCRHTDACARWIHDLARRSFVETFCYTDSDSQHEPHSVARHVRVPRSPLRRPR